ncbi:MAG TPA: hypothetical protein VEU98_09075 [Candidatus Eremiobacteraceae bacterium]|nr:hypothetical protein [Candidatus Eremiobacteraceae bacterium]
MNAKAKGLICQKALIGDFSYSARVTSIDSHDRKQCLPALTIGNGFASLDDARPKLEISEPAFVKHRAVTGFSFDFEPRLAIKAMV